MENEDRPAYKAEILVVDDNHDNLRLLTDMLMKKGYYVRPVSDGNLAISAAMQRIPDLILLDILMPEVDGFEVCKQLKSDDRTRQVPVIFITGLNRLNDKIKAFAQGGIDYIIKPFQEEEVLARINTHLELKMARDSLDKAYRMVNAVFQSIPDMIFSVDENLSIINANIGFEQVCCISRDDHPPAFIRETGKAGKRPCPEVLRKTIETGKPVKEFRTSCNCKNLGKRELVLNTAPLVEPGSHGNGAVLVIRDITRMAELERKMIRRHSYGDIIGKSEPIRKICTLLEQIADVETNVLVTGESGTGKELIADALHYQSARASGPLVKVNCAALSENLLESELFGHVQGAFTGAIKSRIGRIKAAEGGTLFLDEIGDLPVELQAKLLRLIENKEYERLGSSQTLKADIRVVAATNVNLKSAVQSGRFRSDLYYRLKTWVIHLPPLKERKKDIPLLTSHFLARFLKKSEKHIEGLSQEVTSIFFDYPWPGNIRELKSTVEHACVLCPGGLILPGHLPSELLDFRDNRGGGQGNTFTYAPKINRETVLNALKGNDWNKSQAADALGISRSTLYRYMARYSLTLDS